MAGGYLLADIAGGDVHHRNIDEMDMGMVGEAVGMASRTGIDVEVVVLEDVLVVAPPAEILQIVASHDERKTLVGVLLAEMGQRDYGVGGYGQMEFDVAGPHAVIVLDGFADHLQTMVVGQKGAAFLEGVLGGHDEPHLIHIGELQHGVGHDEMSHMDGIERTEEESDVFHLKQKRF